MASRYEIWLCDDAGRRINFLTNLAFFSYARTAFGFSTCTVGMAFDAWQKIAPSIYTPDWRIDIWRAPSENVAMRREKSYLIRKYNVYQRQEDGVRVIELFGRDARDILRRQYLSSWPGGGMTDYLDDIMKYIVTNNIVGTSTVPAGEFAVDGDGSLGPLIVVDFDERNVLDVLNELQGMSESLNLVSSTNKKIYFDVEEDGSLVTNGFGYRFKTYATLRGGDRTKGLLFSVENGNIIEPNLYEDHLDSITAFDVFNQDDPTGDASVVSPDRYLSRWNYVVDGQSSSETNPTVNQNTAYAELQKRRYKKVLNVTFANSPGSADQPRSLYGVDWDLGDLLPVKFAGMTFDVEVKVVYVSVDKNGKETISGRSTLGV